MVARTWAHLLVVLLASAALAGCTGRNDGADDDAGNDTLPPDGGVRPTPNGTAAPADFNLTDSGSITGPFSQSWNIEVANVGFTHAMVSFALTGAQAGAPPTARVNLVLADGDGAPIKTATLGLGGDGDRVEWTLTPADLPAAGTYTLEATSSEDSPLPSVGIANYELMAMVEY